MAITLLHSGRLLTTGFDGGLSLPAGLVDASVGGGSASVIADATAPSSPNSLRCIGTVDGYPHMQGGQVRMDPSVNRQSLSVQFRMKTVLTGTIRRAGVILRYVDGSNYLVGSIENTNIVLMKRRAGTDYNTTGTFTPDNSEWAWCKFYAEGLTYTWKVAHAATPDTWGVATYNDSRGTNMLYLLGNVMFSTWCVGNTTYFDDILVMESNHLTVRNIPAGGYVTLNGVDTKAYDGVCRIPLGDVRLPVTSFTIKDAAGTTLATFSGSAYGGDVFDSGLTYDSCLRTSGPSIGIPHKSSRFALIAPTTVVDTYFATGNHTLKSSMVDPYYVIANPHDFQYIEGPGWPGNSVMGTYIAYRMAGLMSDTALSTRAQSVLSHALYDGQGGTGAWPNRFFEMSAGVPTGRFKGVRKSDTDAYYWNYKFNNLWEAPFYRGWVAYALALWYRALPAGQLKTDCGVYARAIVDWTIANVAKGTNGNLPRYSDPATGAAYARAVSETYGSYGEGADPNAQWATPSLASHILAMVELTLAGVYDYTTAITTDATSLYDHGPFNVTVNQDYDSVGVESYALCAIALYAANRVVPTANWVTKADDWTSQTFQHRVFDSTATAYDAQRVSGLYSAIHPSETSYWAANCYFWENAAVAWAWAEKYVLSGDAKDVDAAAATLSAIAAHRYGPHGWVAEGVLWRYDTAYTTSLLHGSNPGDIKFTEPLLNGVMHGFPFIVLLDRATKLNKAVVPLGLDTNIITGAAAGGGGLLTHPGMGGGARG